MDQIVGVDVLPPTAEKMRRLMHYGQVMQSHVLHFFHLAAPDLLFGFERPGREAQHLRGAARESRTWPARRPDAQVRPGDHRGDGGQEDPRHRRHSRRHQPQSRRSPPATASWRASTRWRTGRWRRWPSRGTIRWTHAELVAGFGSFPVEPHVARARAATARWISTTAACARIDADGGTDLRHAGLQRLPQGAGRGCAQLVLHEVPLHPRPRARSGAGTASARWRA